MGRIVSYESLSSEEKNLYDQLIHENEQKGTLNAIYMFQITFDLPESWLSISENRKYLEKYYALIDSEITIETIADNALIFFIKDVQSYVNFHISASMLRIFIQSLGNLVLPEDLKNRDVIVTMEIIPSGNTIQHTTITEAEFCFSRKFYQIIDTSIRFERISNQIIQIVYPKGLFFRIMQILSDHFLEMNCPVEDCVRQLAQLEKLRKK